MRLLLFLLCLPFLATAQFDVSYSPTSNIVSVHYNGCEACALGSASAVLACQCAYDCSQIENTAEEIAEFDECVDKCESTFDGVNLEYCLDACDRKLDAQRRICLEGCAPTPLPERQILSYRYRLFAVWDAVPFDPLNNPNQDDWIVTDLIFVVSGTINIPNWEVPAPWPTIHQDNNTCYGIVVTIVYTDLTTTCEFVGLNCNIIG